MDSAFYLDRDTTIHRLDPRTKILIFSAVFVLAASFDNPLWVLPTTLMVLLHGFVAHSLSNLRRVRRVLIMVSFTSLIMWSVFAGGQTPLLGFLEAEAVAFAVSRTLLVITMLVSGIVFISTTRNEEFVAGLMKLGLPYRVGFAVSMALRLVPLIADRTQTILQAQRSRGLDLDSGSLLARLRKYPPLMIPVFVSTIREANVLSMALEAKGFGALPQPTQFLEVRLRWGDYACLAALLVLVAAAMGLRLSGYGQIAGLVRF